MFEIKYTWKKIDYENYKKNHEYPAIYKWKFKIYSEEIYIGETKNLRKRIYQYNSKADKTQTTNKIIQEKKANAKNVELYELNISYLKFCSVELINPQIIQTNILKDGFIRKFIENYFILKYKYIDRKNVINKDGRSKNAKSRLIL